MKWVLRLAGVYNLAWGFWLLAAPYASYRYCGLDTPTSPLVNVPVWQCLGMVIGVYGIGYLIASTNPLRHWPIVLVGLLGKVFGPIGFIANVLAGTIPLTGFATIACNDIIWWIPFGLILGRVWRDYFHDAGEPPAESVETALARATTSAGKTLKEMSHVSPVLLVFLRHFG
jgi:hypothetical protein